MNILVTGGTGSFGNAFTRYILPSNPNRLVIYSRDEQKQEDMARRFNALGVDHRCLRFFVGDVRDRDRLEYAMRGITTVVHAAAMKIVPTAEYNPTECIATNIGGAENVVRAAIRANVGRVMGLSTDKAAHPTNLYGASKLAAEKIFIASNAYGGGVTKFSVVRYGNVVGSRGSVIPLFRKLVAEGKDLTVTDIRMTRFWITLQQAVRFTLDCISTMEGREVFVPKIPSALIYDIAKEMAGQNLKVRFTGIRPGEKLHEVLVTEDEARSTIDKADCYIIQPSNYRFATTDARVPDGFRYCSGTNHERVNMNDIRAFVEGGHEQDS